MTLATPQATLEVLKHFSLRLDKSLGQHFLVDQNILNKVTAAGEIEPDDIIVEVGPGIGTLTQALAERAGTVIPLELDRRLKPILEYTLKDYPNTHPLFTDAMSADLANLPGGLPQPGKLIANLPYQIATPLLATYLDRFPFIKRYVFMVQKEVADRILAAPGSKQYGSFSVKAQFYCRVERVATVSKNVFIPPPEVNSAVVKMVRLPEPSVAVMDKDLFFKVVKAAFWQRRKILRNAISSSPELTIPQSAVESALSRSGIDPQRRGETLSVKEFALLANALVEQV